MCGITGVFNLDGRPVERRTIERMTATLVHRGPDGLGIWVDGPVGFGHRRLSIRDLSDRGRQPMLWGETGPAVTFNGEIYNDRSIRQRLEQEAGCRFRTTCDTEIIAPAYRHWGPAAFGRFHGMFSIGLWDRDRGELVLARDPVGIKPLYFSVVGRSLRFASELKALVALDDQPAELDLAALHTYLGQGYPGPGRSLIGARDDSDIIRIGRDDDDLPDPRRDGGLSSHNGVVPTVVNARKRRRPSEDHCPQDQHRKYASHDRHPSLFRIICMIGAHGLRDHETRYGGSVTSIT